MWKIYKIHYSNGLRVNCWADSNFFILSTKVRFIPQHFNWSPWITSLLWMFNLKTIHLIYNSLRKFGWSWFTGWERLNHSFFFHFVGAFQLLNQCFIWLISKHLDKTHSNLIRSFFNSVISFSEGLSQFIHLVKNKKSKLESFLFLFDH